MLLVAANAACAALVVATFGSALGATRLHHDVAYAALALGTLAGWARLRRRRLATLLMASLGAWSLVTGLLLVYLAPGFGHARWMRWWHGATSVGFALAFLAHWARNQPRLAGLARAAWGAPVPRLAFVGAWTLVAFVGAVSWTTGLRKLFDDRYFRELTTLSFLLAGLVLVYGLLAATSARLRERLARSTERNRLRGALDLSLLAAVWLATVTGLPLLYLARGLRSVDAYWFVAGWHVVASAILVGLVVGHAALNRRPLRAHLR